MMGRKKGESEWIWKKVKQEEKRRKKKNKFSFH